MPLRHSRSSRSQPAPASMSAAASEVISRHWEAPPPLDALSPSEAAAEKAESFEGSAAIRKRRAKALVSEWVAGDTVAGERIARMLERGDGETRIALVDALPNTVPFEVIEAALTGMRRSFLGGSAKTERRGWTVVTAILGAGLVLDLLITIAAASSSAFQNFYTIAVLLATAPGLVAWQVMCIHRRIQMAIDSARQQQYFSRVAVIARTSLQRDPGQYAQPVLHRLEEMAPAVELEGGNTKKVYRQAIRTYQDAVAHLRSLPIASEGTGAGPDLLPVPSSGDFHRIRTTETMGDETSGHLS